MLSSFHGLETSRRALNTAQAALHTTGHNIANANTPGYSRQRVNFTQTEAFPNPGFNQPGIPGQLGTGVKAGEIQRVREAFLDLQFRGEHTKHGYWSTKQNALERMEDIMNELNDGGISAGMDRFWESLEDLSVSPEDSGARSVVQQRGIALAETINHTYESLEAIQRDYREQLGVQAGDHNSEINSILRQINDLNKQIASVEPHGYLPNDLYDKRDALVDDLSKFVNIEVERVGSGGQAKDMAEGKYNIHLLDDNGSRLNDILLVDGDNFEYSEVGIEFEDGDGPVTHISFGEESLSFSEFNSTGSLKGLVEAYGYIDGEGNERGLFNEMMQDLDTMVETFVEEFNEVHSSGWSLSEIENGREVNEDGEEGFDFFAFAEGYEEGNGGAAKYLKVSDDILESGDNIAAAAEIIDEDGNATAYAGDGSNALNLADVKDTALDYGSEHTNVQSFFRGVIGDMAVNLSEAQSMERNTHSLRESINERRQSVSSVSLDEEMSNMIMFQHAYNAAARNLTAIDEMLDRIINGMGVVGR